MRRTKRLKSFQVIQFVLIILAGLCGVVTASDTETIPLKLFGMGKPINGEIAKRIEGKQIVSETLNFIARDSKLAKKFTMLIQEAAEKQNGGDPV